MKQKVLVLLVLILSAGLLMSGCFGGKETPSNDAQQREEQQEEMQPRGEISTQVGVFQGMADGHSAEILVDGEAQVYQFFDETIAASFETLEPDTEIQFDVELDAETDQQTVVKLYDAPAEG